LHPSYFAACFPQISQHGQSAWFGRIDRQRAAVAADLALLWRRSMAAAAAEEEQGGPVRWVLPP
jgi:hypothetical protein